jgi:hypothetical protein
VVAVRVTGGGGASTLTELSDVTGHPGFGRSPVDDGSGVFPLTRVTTEDDLNGILAIVADVEYHRFGDPGEPPLESGFADYGPPYAPARWRLQSNNVLRLDGAITNPAPLTGPTVIARMPDGCRPDTTHVFMAPSDQSISRIDVDADGTIIWYVYLVAGGSGAQGYLSLSTVSYSVVATAGPPTIP